MLNPDETIVLLAEHAGVRVLIGLHPQPGNYEAYLPPGLEPEVGSLWDFFCPVCQRSLVTAVAPDRCALDVRIEGAKHRVYFSRRAGEQATFVVSAEGLLARHGSDAGKHSLDLLELM